MWTYALTLSLGIICPTLWHYTPSWVWGVGIIFIGLGVFYISPLLHKKIMIYFIIFCFGFNWWMFRVNLLHHVQLPHHLTIKPVKIKGTVTQIINQTSHMTSFIFKTSFIDNKINYKKVLLSWYNRHPNIHVGDQWKFSVRLKLPHILHNPLGFRNDYWFFQHGINARGYVVMRFPFHLLNVYKSHTYLNKWRADFSKKIKQVIKNHELSALISALTLGDRQGFTNHHWEILQKTGTSHLVAISGLHVGLVTSSIYLFILFFCRFISTLLLYIPAQKIAVAISLIFTVMYCWIVGFSLPTQRALIMSLVFAISTLCSRYQNSWYRLSIAYVIIVIYEPMSLWSKSFWLSFSAVSCVLYGTQYVNTITNKLKQWLWMQWCVCVGLMPISLYFFGQVSLVMFFTNLIAIPWISLLVLPLCLIAMVVCFISLSYGQILLWLAGESLKPLWMGLGVVAHLPFIIWHHSIFSLFTLAILLCAAILTLTAKHLTQGLLACMCWLPLFFSHPVGPSLGGVWLTLLDVGQGLAIIVRTAHHCLIYDTGPRTYGGFDAGREVILPYLKRQNLYPIDIMMISHGDLDHRGGARSILRQINVKQVITSDKERFKAYHVKACYNGEHWHWDGVDFTVLGPRQGARYQGNNSSCVLQISNGKRTILLPGDIEETAETWLMTQYRNHLAADVLVAPHHGSITSSSKPFVYAVRPLIVLFGVGFQNRYGFPNDCVKARYRHIGAHMYDTANDGAVTVRITEQGRLKVAVAYRFHLW